MSHESSAITAQLRAELARLDRRLAEHVRRLQARGRPATALAGHVVADNEVASLLGVLATEHADRQVVADEDDDHDCLLTTLEQARVVFGLTPFDCAVLVLALASEVDGRYARVFAYVNDHGGHTWPTLGLAIALFESMVGNNIDVVLARFTPEAPLRHYGLIDVTGSGPMPTHRILLAKGMLERLLGLAVHCGVAVDTQIANGTTEVVLGDDQAARVRSAARWLAASPPRPVVVIRGNPGTGRDSVARVLAREIVNAVVIDELSDVPESLVLREATWHDAPIITRALESARLLALARGDRPLFVITDNATILPALDRPQIELVLRDLDSEDRKRLWRAILPDRDELSEQTLALLAARFRFGPSQIATVARTTRARSAVTDVGRRPRDVLVVARELAHVELSGLTQRLPCPFERGDIVLQGGTERELDLAITWARHAGSVFAALPGMARWSAPGLTCLFVGPPGTGKTMAAQVLAREIGLDLWRVDVSQLFNKYIGETEKNLAKIFDAAEQASAILFFDEADAVFGRRTDVKSANDRFANVETAFLLQRLEMHPGIAILASNLRGNIDSAFMRRLHVIAEFALPTPAERLQLWERLIPPRQRRESDIDSEFLAKRFAIAGGDIRNAAMAALVLAARDGEPLAMRHLVFGLWRELRKSGRMVELSEFGPWQHVVLEWSKQENGAREVSA